MDEANKISTRAKVRLFITTQQSNRSIQRKKGFWSRNLDKLSQENLTNYRKNNNIHDCAQNGFGAKISPHVVKNKEA